MESKRDQNRITAVLGTSDLDDSTTIRVYADATTRGLYAKVVSTFPDLLYATDPALEISAGEKVLLSRISHVNKFGRNPDIAIGVREEIWEGSVAYVYPTTATITHIRSAVNSADTRGKTIEIQGLDASWNLVVQTKDTNAANSTTEVELDTPLIRVFRMKVLENVVLDQNIWIGATGVNANLTKAIIVAGNNQTLMAIYTIPNGKTGYLTNWYASVNPASNLDPTSMPISVWARDNDNGYEKQVKHVTGLISGHVQHNYEPYNKFTQKTDIFMTATPVGKAADVSGGFDIILVDN